MFFNVKGILLLYGAYQTISTIKEVGSIVKHVVYICENGYTWCKGEKIKTLTVRRY